MMHIGLLSQDMESGARGCKSSRSSSVYNEFGVSLGYIRHCWREKKDRKTEGGGREEGEKGSQEEKRTQGNVTHW